MSGMITLCPLSNATLNNATAEDDDEISRMTVVIAWAPIVLNGIALIHSVRTRSLAHNVVFRDFQAYLHGFAMLEAFGWSIGYFKPTENEVACGLQAWIITAGFNGVLWTVFLAWIFTFTFFGLCRATRLSKHWVSARRLLLGFACLWPPVSSLALVSSSERKHNFCLHNDIIEFDVIKMPLMLAFVFVLYETLTSPVIRGLWRNGETHTSLSDFTPEYARGIMQSYTWQLFKLSTGAQIYF